MVDQPSEVVVVTQTTPGRTVMSDDVGARSAYDPAVQSPAAVSAAALAATMQQMLTAPGDGSVGSTDIVGGVSRTVAQTTPNLPPITVHTSSYGYTIPMG